MSEFRIGMSEVRVFQFSKTRNLAWLYCGFLLTIASGTAFGRVIQSLPAGGLAVSLGGLARVLLVLGLLCLPFLGFVAGVLMVRTPFRFAVLVTHDTLIVRNLFRTYRFEYPSEGVVLWVPRDSLSGLPYGQRLAVSEALWVIVGTERVRATATQSHGRVGRGRDATKRKELVASLAQAYPDWTLEQIPIIS